MRHFCTYLDRGYLLRGLALYRSLLEHLPGPFTLWVLCFDDTAYRTLSALNRPDLRPVALDDFERGDEALLRAKADRSRVEYFFTCSPSWPLYLLNRQPDIDLITYLDADLFFFSDPTPIFDELGDRSILIVAHRFPEHLRYLEIHGVYNVGLLAFRNDRHGRQCLDWWRARCLEWCYDRPEAGRYADQKYLDDWPTRFEGVVVLQHKGADLAPWNWTNYPIRVEGGRVLVDGQPLIFFHFQGVKQFNRWLTDPGVTSYGPMLPVGRWLYPRYVRALRETRQWAVGFGLDIDPGYARLDSRGYSWKRLVKRLALGRLMISLR